MHVKLLRILNISPCHLYATVAVTMASISYHHSKEKLGKQNEYGKNSSFGFIEAVHQHKARCYTMLPMAHEQT